MSGYAYSGLSIVTRKLVIICVVESLCLFTVRSRGNG